MQWTFSDGIIFFLMAELILFLMIQISRFRWLFPLSKKARGIYFIFFSIVILIGTIYRTIPSDRYFSNKILKSISVGEERAVSDFFNKKMPVEIYHPWTADKKELLDTVWISTKEEVKSLLSLKQTDDVKIKIDEALLGTTHNSDMVFIFRESEDTYVIRIINKFSNFPEWFLCRALSKNINSPTSGVFAA